MSYPEWTFFVKGFDVSRQRCSRQKVKYISTMTTIVCSCIQLVLRFTTETVINFQHSPLCNEKLWFKHIFDLWKLFSIKFPLLKVLNQLIRIFLGSICWKISFIIAYEVWFKMLDWDIYRFGIFCNRDFIRNFYIFE